MITLENDYLSVNINSRGAELTSLFDKRDGVEHMWSAASEYWPRRAPILFPCVGESRNGEIQVSGNNYLMGRHGFARMHQFDVVESTPTRATFELMDNEETLRAYPFLFRLRITFKLEGEMLIHHFEVLNTGKEKLGFQLGGHPAFTVPFKTNEQFSDYQIKFDRYMNLDRHLLSDKGLYTGETRNVLDDEDGFDLFYNLFEEDALVFKHIPSKEVSIQHKQGGKRLQVNYEGFPHLGIWSIPGANYVCIEPWIGCADQTDQPNDFWLKDSLVFLDSKEQFEAVFSVSVIAG